MTAIIKYIGDGGFINGLPARDLTREDWEVIGRQGRQAQVLEAGHLYEVVDKDAVGDVAVEAGAEAGAETEGLLETSKDINEALAAGGYTTVEAVNAASDEELLALDGIGPKKLKEIRAAVDQSLASDAE